MRPQRFSKYPQQLEMDPVLPATTPRRTLCSAPHLEMRLICLLRLEKNPNFTLAPQEEVCLTCYNVRGTPSFLPPLKKTCALNSTGARTHLLQLEKSITSLPQPRRGLTPLLQLSGTPRSLLQLDRSLGFRLKRDEAYSPTATAQGIPRSPLQFRKEV